MDIKRIFTRFDTDGDGKISPAELRRLMRTISHELSLNDAEATVKSTDLNGDGFLDIDEFIQFVGTNEEDKELREAFEMYIEKGEGCITTASLKRMLSRLGTSKRLEECMEMICRYDEDGDGVISFDEFKAMIG